MSVRKRLGLEDYNDLSWSLLKLQVRMYDRKEEEGSRLSKGQDTKDYHDLMARNVGERNEVEATFGPGKRIYRANNIRAKRV